MIDDSVSPPLPVCGLSKTQRASMHTSKGISVSVLPPARGHMYMGVYLRQPNLVRDYASGGDMDVPVWGLCCVCF